VTSTPARSALVAAVWTLLNCLLALVLFQHADAGPLADVILLSFPFIVGGLGLGAGRYAWPVYSEHETGARRVLALLALVGNGVLVAAALLMVLLILNGPMVG